MSDEGIDPALIGGILSDDMERTLEMRRVAQKAFCEYNARQSVNRALQARPRIWQEYQPGQYVFVYRVPRAKKRKQGGIGGDDVAANKTSWVGPETVIAVDGANLWISMIGKLWRVSREQCRPATTDEKHGVEAVLHECRELIEQYKRQPHRAKTSPWRKNRQKPCKITSGMKGEITKGHDWSPSEMRMMMTMVQRVLFWIQTKTLDEVMEVS